MRINDIVNEIETTRGRYIYLSLDDYEDFYEYTKINCDQPFIIRNNSFEYNKGDVHKIVINKNFDDYYR